MADIQTPTTPPLNPEQPVKVKKPIYKRVWFWIAVVLVILIALAGLNGTRGSNNSPSVASSTSSSTTSNSQSEASTSQEDTLELQATASGQGTALYGESGSSSTESFTQNWSKTFTGDDAKKFMTVSVTGDFTAGDDQKVSCTIIKNGKQISHKEASGAAGSAFCSTLD